MAVPEPALPFYAMLRYAPAIHLVSCFNVREADKQQAVADIGDGLAAGTLNHHVGATFALADTAAAHEAVEGGGVIGNVVLTIDGD